MSRPIVPAPAPPPSDVSNAIKHARDLCIDAGMLFDPAFGVLIWHQKPCPTRKSGPRYVTIGYQPDRIRFAYHLTHHFGIQCEQNAQRVLDVLQLGSPLFLLSFHDRPDCHVRWHAFHGDTLINIEATEIAYPPRNDRVMFERFYNVNNV